MATPPASNGNFQVFAEFSGEDGGCTSTNAVFLLPPAYDYGKSSKISLSNLYLGGMTLPQGWRNDDFSVALVESGSGSPNQTNVAVQITLAGKNMWNCAAPARATLMANFTSFILWIEANLELNGILVPGAAMIIAQQIAANMPAPPLETLFYQYGFISGLAVGTTPSINIMPGMQIRIDTEVSQFVSPGSAFNGYVGAGSFSYGIGSVSPTSPGLPRPLAFDPFLGMIAAPKITNPSPIVAGGVIDLLPVGGAQPYWKLFYPTTLTSPSNAGQAGMTNNVALIGAGTLNDLNTALENLPACTSTTTCAYFAGRTIVVPLIPIFISVRNLYAVEWVPIGTTFRHIVERYGSVSPGSDPGTLVRGPGPVKFWHPSTTSLVDPREYDVPLIGGDVVTPTLLNLA